MRSREHDAQAGMPSFRKTSEQGNNRARNIGIGAAALGLVAAGVLGRRQIGQGVSRLHEAVNPRMLTPVKGTEGAITEAVVGRRFGLPTQRLRTGETGDIITQQLRSLSDRFGAASTGQQLGAVGAGMAGVGLATKGIQRGRARVERIQEGGRFREAMRNVNIDEAAGLGYYGADEREPLRQQAAEKLRSRFGVLNKYAPNVAKDPLLAAEFLSREAVRAQDVVSPEEYLRKVREAVDLENAIQRSTPDPLQQARFASSIVGM